MYVNTHLKRGLSGVFVTLLFLFSALWKLSSPSIYQWDEALYANNALEMCLNNDFWTMRVDGSPTLYNTKPPLAIWLKAVSMRLFGVHELSVRLPSVFALVGIFFIIYRFCKKHLDIEIALLSFTILLLSLGFMRIHVVRSGDLDAVLSFFTTLFIFAFYDLVLSKNGFTTKQFVWLSVGFTGTFFTKSTACLVPIPALFLSGFVLRKDVSYLKNKGFIAAFLLPICFIIAYYWHMEGVLEGYFNKVYFSEFQRSYKDLMPWFEHPWYYYFDKISKFFFPFILFFPLALFTKQPIAKLLATFSLLFLVFISLPPTKLEWYIAPIYPIASVCIAVLYVEIWKKAIESKIKLLPLGLILFLFLVIIYPIKELYKTNSDAGISVELEKSGFFMRELHKRKPNVKNYVVTMSSRHEEHYQQAVFYKRTYNHFDGYNIRFTPTIKTLNATDTVLVCQFEKFDSLKTIGFIEIIDSSERYGHCKLLIKSR